MNGIGLTGPNGGSRGRPQNLRPWKPGQSGNPHGVPQSYRDAIAIYRQAGPEAAREIVRRAYDPNEDPRLSMMALFHIIERAYGKPKEMKDIEEKPERVDLSKCTPEQLARLKQLMNEAKQTLGMPVDVEMAADGDASRQR